MLLASLGCPTTHQGIWLYIDLLQIFSSQYTQNAPCLLTKGRSTFKGTCLIQTVTVRNYFFRKRRIPAKPIKLEPNRNRVLGSGTAAWIP